jgi:hypothetical protein
LTRRGKLGRDRETASFSKELIMTIRKSMLAIGAFSLLIGLTLELPARAEMAGDATRARLQQKAEDADRKAALHEHWAERYRALKLPKPAYMAEMCDNMAADFRKQAADARAQERAAESK